MMPSIDGIILASGFSRRMGRDKLLLPVGEDLVVERVIRTALKSRLSKVILVYRNEMVAEIGKDYGIETIKNDKARLGQAESVKKGVSASDGDGYLFVAGDQPFLTCDLINGMIWAFKNSGKGIIVPILEEKIHMPILFSEKYRFDLLKIHGEKGGFEIITNNKEDIHWYHVDDPRDVRDINTDIQYMELIGGKERKNHGIQDREKE
ncbi:MAG: nucleotidyltransferase family protein [Bacillota bacterium]